MSGAEHMSNQRFRLLHWVYCRKHSKSWG